MLIIGCDYHPGFEKIAFVDTDTGELSERRLDHREQAEQFYRELKQQNPAISSITYCDQDSFLRTPSLTGRGMPNYYVGGSDRVPDPNDSKRAQVGNAQAIHESEMALFYDCTQLCAQILLDTADIARDRDVRQLSCRVSLSLRAKPNRNAIFVDDSFYLAGLTSRYGRLERRDWFVGAANSHKC